MLTNNKMKTCTHCNKEKPDDDFPNSVNGGKEGRCKQCKYASVRETKRRSKLGLTKPKSRIKPVSEVEIQPFDPDLEDMRHVQNLVEQFGIEGVKAKIRLEAFAT